MILQELICDGFRCLGYVRLRPEPGVNVLFGDNAQGKTSVLESVLFLATSKSHRTAQERELAQHGRDGFRLSAHVMRRDREVRIEANWWKGIKRFKVNGVAQTRISDILGKFNVVFFSPEDVALISGAATHRRRFLDMGLSQLQPDYLRALQDYRQLLRQRNELLRHPKPDADMLDVWDEQLAKSGAVLIRERRAFVDEIGAFARAAYRGIASDEELQVLYRPDVKHASTLREVFGAARASDLRHGQTGRGPHRDDLEFEIGGRAARQYASQGQQRTAALAVKLAELELAHARTGEYPVLLLDDVLSELDPGRAQRLFQAIPSGVQCLITTTGLMHREAVSGVDGAHFRVCGGAVEAE